MHDRVSRNRTVQPDNYSPLIWDALTHFVSACLLVCTGVARITSVVLFELLHLCVCKREGMEGETEVKTLSAG
jgi:hypothetical protein